MTRHAFLWDGLIVTLLLFLLILPIILILIVRPAPLDPAEFQRLAAERAWDMWPSSGLGGGHTSLHGLHLFFTAIAADMLIFFLIVRSLRIVKTWPAIIAVVFSYLAGCGTSILVFYLVWGVWKPIKLPQGETFWEDLTLPLRVPDYDRAQRIYQSFYIDLPIIALLVFVLLAWLLILSERKRSGAINSNPVMPL